MSKIIQKILNFWPSESTARPCSCGLRPSFASMAAADDDSFSSSPSLQEDRRLSLTLKRQLLSDIDEEGSIANFKLEDLILKKPDLYGAYDTSPDGLQKQKKLRNVVSYWKHSNSQGTFDLVCTRLSRRASILDPNLPPVAEVSTQRTHPNPTPSPRPSPLTLPSPRQTPAAIVPRNLTAIMSDYAGKRPTELCLLLVSLHTVSPALLSSHLFD